MLEENETLFVEHKSSVDGEAYKVAEAVASFANTLGGWVLIGVRNGKPTGWEPPESLTDRVRQALDHWLDPLPAFAARVFDYGGDRIGLVRVYESADTPHVLRNGKVVVRSVAEVRDQTRIYRPGGVDTQLVLRELANRGARASSDAIRKLRPGLAEDEAGVVMTRLSDNVVTSGHIVVRAVPLAGNRLRELAVSRTGRDLIEAAVRALTPSNDVDPKLTPQASGLVCELQELRLPLLPQTEPEPRTVISAADAGGVVVVAIRLHTPANRSAIPDTVSVSLDGVRDVLIVPLLRATIEILAGAELYGRSIVELRFELPDVGWLLDVPPKAVPLPRVLRLRGEVALPLAAAAPDLDALADQWRNDLGREAGFPTLRE